MLTEINYIACFGYFKYYMIYLSYNSSCNKKRKKLSIEKKD